MIDQNQFGIVILAIFILNGLLLIWVIDQMSRLRQGHKQPEQPAAPDPAIIDKQQLAETMQQKAEAEVAAITAKMAENLGSFNSQLEAVLLNQATTTLKAQLTQTGQTVVDFNNALKVTVASMTTTLMEASKAAQSQLEAGVVEQERLLIGQFEKNLASVINNYLITALGHDSVTTEQTAQVIRQLEANKDELRKDLLHEK